MSFTITKAARRRKMHHYISHVIEQLLNPLPFHSTFIPPSASFSHARTPLSLLSSCISTQSAINPLDRQPALLSPPPSNPESFAAAAVSRKLEAQQDSI